MIDLPAVGRDSLFVSGQKREGSSLRSPGTGAMEWEMGNGEWNR